MKIIFNKISQYRFCLPASQSPTFYNVSKYLQEQGWQYSQFHWRSHFSEKNFHFDTVAAEHLEYKHLLAKLVNQFCPHVMPKTYMINDQNWPFVLSNWYEDEADSTWILKPALMNNGQHIKIFQHPRELEAHYLNSNRIGGEHVLQRYITDPHLLRGHKYTIRLFVVLTNNMGGYLYPKGYFNVAQLPYQPQYFSDLRPHLTNEHLDSNAPNVFQIPTEKFDFFPVIFPQIQAIVLETILSLKTLYPNAFLYKKQKTIAIFGFDFIVDVSQRVWLLEANHGPCFPCSDAHPLQTALYHDFWQAFIANFVFPIAKYKPKIACNAPTFIPIEG